MDQRCAEKSVQIMNSNCGGAMRDEAANRWGKVMNPPEEWLYHPEDAAGSSRVEGVQGNGSGLAIGNRAAAGLAGGISGTKAAITDRGARAQGGQAVTSVGRTSGQASATEHKSLSSGFRPIYD